MNTQPSVVCLNGAFVPDTEARVSLFDRGFLYGDGLFETLRVYRGRPFRWTQHVSRLLAGARLLRLALPFSAAELELLAMDLIRRNSRAEAILRVNVSRGVGPRGYSPSRAKTPFYAMSLHPAPALSVQRPVSVRLRTCGWPVPSGGSFGSCKSTSRLLHVLARAEAEAAGADEALMLNDQHHVAEASGANVFWVVSGRVHTPPLDSGALDGVTRRAVLELCARAGIRTAEQSLPAAALRHLETVFLTSSIQEVVRVKELDGRALPPSLLVDQIHRLYHDQARRECS